MKIYNNIIAILFLIANATSAQNLIVKYDYDLNGNRTIRTIEVIELKRPDTIISLTDFFICYQENNNTYFEEPNELKILIEPNPVTNNLHIQSGINSFVEYTYLILDSNGKTLVKGENHQHSFIISLQHIDAGLYYLLINNKGSTRYFKIIKI